jgi:hypothetical protein
MKTKTVIMLFLFIGFGFAQLSAQTLKKGTVIGIKTYNFTLQPDVTMNQCLDFWINKYNPEVEKCYPGVKIFVMGADRGEKKNQFAEVVYIESVKLRDKYWPSETDTAYAKLSEFERNANKKLKPFDEEWAKLVLPGASLESTDWIIK